MTGNKSFLVTTVPRFLFWVLLTPLLISSSGIVCTPRTGDTRLASLEIEVLGENRIAFDSAVRVYDVGIPPDATTVTVRAEAIDTQARLTWYVPDGAGMLASGIIGVGSDQVTVDLPPDGFSLYVGVLPPGGAVNSYIMTFVSCSNDCSDGNECTADVCDPDNGTCSNPDEMDGVACDFGGLPGVCAAGMCEDAMLCAGVDCSDGQECTTDLCDPADGTCADHTIETDGTACDFDGFPGMCELGTCEDAMLCAGVDCSDGQECTTDLCDRADGSCFYANETEGTACDFGGFPGMCAAGMCEDAMLCAGVDCNDDQECTTDVCDRADGGCYHTVLADDTPCDLVGGNGFCTGGLCDCIPDDVASVTVSPDTWDANRIGHRQPLTATVLNACGNPIPGAQSTWVSSNTNVAHVDANGLVTAVSSGAADVTVTSDGEAATITLTVTSEVESAVLDLCWAAGLGEAECRAELADPNATLYTVWFARSDDAPALLVDGELKVAKDMYCLHHAQNIWMVCPAIANFPPNATYTGPDNNAPPGPDNNDANDNDPNVLPNFPNPPDPTTPWSYPDVAKFQWEGDRIGILSDMSGGTGTFRVVDRHEEWIVHTLIATDFQLEGNRMAVVTDDGTVHTLWVKDGNTPGGWSAVDSRASGVRQFQLKGDYIGVLYDNELFRVKQGINGTWHNLNGTGVTEFAMEIVPGGGVRIGAVASNGTASTVWVKEGITPGGWSAVDSRDGVVRQFEMKGDYIGVLYEHQLFRVKQGITGSWVSTGGVTEFAMEIVPGSGVRIGQLFDTGAFTVKDGILGAPTTVSTGVTRIQLQENYIGALLVDGTLRIKEGIFGEWRHTTEAYGPGVTQFRLVVDVPVPPERTTPLIRAAKVATCAFWTAPLPPGQPGVSRGCEPNRIDKGDIGGGEKASYYGYFSGGPLPGSDPAWDWAVAYGPLDPMDALSMHHDASYSCPCPDSDPDYNASWYPEKPLGLLNGAVEGNTCVVRYGLDNAKLTRNGTPIDISMSGRADWVGLEDLYDAIYVGGSDSYHLGANQLCPFEMVEDFAYSTRAKHNPAPVCKPAGDLCLLGNSGDCCSRICGFPSGANPVLRCGACKPAGAVSLLGYGCCSGSSTFGFCD